MAGPAPATRMTGFTLLEMVVAMALMGLVITLGVTLKDMVLRAGYKLSAGDRDWTAELFLRDQLRQLGRGLGLDRPLIAGDGRELTLITRRSARFGRDGPPVLARWRFDAGRTRLLYEEALLPPWWGEPEGNFDSLLEAWERNSDLPHSWQTTIFPDLANGYLAYWQDETKDWTDRWTRNAPPAAIRIETESLLEDRRLVLETGASSLFSFSGS